MLNSSAHHRSAVLLVCNDGNRGMTVDGKAYSQLLDPIGESLIDRGVPVRSAPGSFRSKLVGPAAFNNPRPFRRVETGAMIVASVVRRLGFQFVGAWLESRVWHRVLAKSAVGVVLAIQPSEGLCLAGHQRGLAVVDFQHGQINLESTYYKRCRRDLLKQRAHFVPSEIRCWDAVSAAGAWREVGLPAAIAGHPGLALPHCGPDENQVAQLVSPVVSEYGTVGDRCVVLVVDGWTESSSDELLRHEFLCAIADAKRALPEVHFLVRAHPVQHRTLWSQTAAEYAEVFRDQVAKTSYAKVAEAPLFDLLSQCSLVVTRGSGAIIEAGYLGVPVAVVGAKFQDLRSIFQREYLEDVTWLARESSAITDWVEQHRGQKCAVRVSRRASAHQAAMNNWLDEIAKGLSLSHRI